MSEEERLGVWRAQPEAGAAWDKLSAELDDATATDPLAAGWAEDPPPAAAAPDEEEEEQAPTVQDASGGGGGGSAGSAATAVAAGPFSPPRTLVLLQPAGPYGQALPMQQVAFSWPPVQAGVPLQVRCRVPSVRHVAGAALEWTVEGEGGRESALALRH